MNAVDDAVDAERTVNAGRIEAAYARVHPRLWRALLAFTGDPDVAADAEAEAFVQLLGRGDAVRDPDAWVWRTAFRIASGLLADRRTTETLTADSQLASIDDSTVIELLSQLTVLSDQQRAIVALRYVGNFRPVEIADMVNTSPGTVRVQLHRAHATLRMTMEEELHG